jgi:hypothetical protein
MVQNISFAPFSFCTQHSLKLMVSTRAGKRAVLSGNSPLLDAGILQRVCEFVGPGQHIFVATVSKAFRAACAKVRSHVILGLRYMTHWKVIYSAKMTLTRSAFASVSRFKWALDCGLQRFLNGRYSEGPFGEVIDNEFWRLQRIAGQFSDVETLQAALDAGVPLSPDMICGAAESGSLAKLLWLHTEHNCQLFNDITDHAARGGHVDMLTWLKDNGLDFTDNTFKYGAMGGSVPVLQYLQEQKCPWDHDVSEEAARHGQLAALKWLLEHGAPEGFLHEAAENGGDMETLEWVTARLDAWALEEERKEQQQQQQ